MYRITTVKTISGQVFTEPMVTCEAKPTALKRMNAAIKDAESELGTSEAGIVGGQIEITLEECAHAIGGKADTIAHAVIKRPVNSPKAETFRDGL